MSLCHFYSFQITCGICSKTGRKVVIDATSGFTKPAARFPSACSSHLTTKTGSVHLVCKDWNYLYYIVVV